MKDQIRRHMEDQRGTGKRLKEVLPPTLFRSATRAFNLAVGLAPYGLKYTVATHVRRRKYPYSLLCNGDTVIQIGAPRDTLHAGRSRAIHFARLVGNGKVLVVEPDTHNVAALEKFLVRTGLGTRVLVAPFGAWSVTGELTLLASDRHPASNVVEVVRPTAAESALRDYRRVTVPVRTVDELILEYGLAPPKLISITTNGAELQILEGMASCIMQCRYISLASTGEGYHEFMARRGFEYIARDDRGYLFERLVD